MSILQSKRTGSVNNRKKLDYGGSSQDVAGRRIRLRKLGHILCEMYFARLLNDALWKKRGEYVKKALSAEERERRVAEDMWLNYFNRYLWEHSTISETEYKKMTEKIATRRAKLSCERSER